MNKNLAYFRLIQSSVILAIILMLFTGCSNVVGEDGTIAVTGLTLSQSILNMTVGGEDKILYAIVLPINATNKEVVWDSSNKAAATVINGTVTAVGTGTSDIIVTTEDGYFMATCKVTVTLAIIGSIPVNGVTLNKSTLNLIVGGAGEQLTATVSPGNATNKGVFWDSSNKAVATVNNGTVTAVSPGTSEITVTTAERGFTAKCTVTVIPGIVPVSGIALNKNTLSLTAGGSGEKLTATVSPYDATNKAVIWGSSNSNIAAVEDGMVSPVSEGTANITVTTANGMFTATCIVTVSLGAGGAVAVTGVTLDRNTLDMIVGGATERLIAAINPSTATNKAVAWDSSNSAVATVNNGTVTAVGPGTAVITVITLNGGFTASCTVTVIKNINFGVKFVWESNGIVLTAEVSESSLLVSENPLVVKEGAVVKITAPNSFSTYEWRVGMEVISTENTCLFNAETASAKPYVINLLVGNPEKGTSIEITVQE